MSVRVRFRATQAARRPRCHHGVRLRGIGTLDATSADAARVAVDARSSLVNNRLCVRALRGTRCRLRDAFAPCPAVGRQCRDARWSPREGHVPRGFLGAIGQLSEVELVLVVAEPGDPLAGEDHSGHNPDDCRLIH
jgi:hypothetical protein